MVTRLASVLCLLLAVGCREHGDYVLVHHRANGCDGLAQENSLRALRCIRERCESERGPCALEGDARALRLEGGSLGEVDGADLEIIWLHDGTTTRTASCPGGAIELPGESEVSSASFSRCRLVLTDGSESTEPIPTLDDVLDEVAGSSLQLFLELKTSGDSALDEELTRGSLEKVRVRGLREQVVIASFDLGALTLAKEEAMRTACFTPSGALGEQLLSLVRGSVVDDVDQCLSVGHDMVFVTPGQLQGSIASHIRHAGKELGVFGADTADGHDAVLRWSSSVHIVYADDVSMYLD